MSHNYVIFASYGNDSIALIQWAREHQLSGVTVCYNDTGWAANWWLEERVEKAETWVQSFGFQTARTQSEGMLRLVERKHAWPRGGGGKYQFCTQALKKNPALYWLTEVDPAREAVCMVGIRREESFNRASFPEWTEESREHDGRSLWAPLVNHRENARNALIMQTPFEVLPHKSRECFPCVNARKAEIAALPEERIHLIRRQEKKMGINSKNNAIVMFSPKRHHGAVGIDAVQRWAQGCEEEAKAQPGCDGGWCGE